ncbi:MAG: hypothetical protein KBC41_00170 [Candidatus Pacebacteria bacterium]|nr:hypothetical protein [Candidatus Paceibacterota bacterium]MBP9866482.1 hypothetical protein [Candidatus Paceibacterota bacterium]
MKRHLKKYTSITNYIEFIRRQPSHVQHVYGVVFAGTITSLIAFFILYIDYGFWHERYINDDIVKIANEEEQVKLESPTKMFGSFLEEAGERFKEIKIPNKALLEGKESYSQENQ